jgi:hypothetical protein
VLGDDFDVEEELEATASAGLDLATTEKPPLKIAATAEQADGVA